MPTLLRWLCLSLLLAPLACLADGLIDLAGHPVKRPAKLERILLGEGRMLTNLVILDRELPRQRVVGMLDDFAQLDPGLYAQYLRIYPELAKISRLSRGSSGFSVEQALALRPDLAIFGLGGHGPDASDVATRQRLEAAGVSVVYIDFTADPLRNTRPSLRLLGELFGRQAQADSFIRFYEAELAKVSQGLAGLKQKTSVFIDSRVGLALGCCETLSNGMLGRLVDLAGGDNIAKPLVPGAHGTVNLEFLLQRQPSVYVATAIGNPTTLRQQSARIPLGAGIDATTAQAGLQRALQREGIVHLQAVRQGRAHALSHHFNYSASHVAAVQVLAKWLYPERFRSLDPQATLQQYYARFQPVPLPGVYWVSAP